MKLFTWLGNLWCTWFHFRHSWPVRGEYICFECHRRFRVRW